MIYFANPTSGTRDVMLAGQLGYIDTPKQGNKRPAGVVWCADNGCFGKGFSEDEWWSWLVRHAGDAATCVFATAPDVVGDAGETLSCSLPWLPRIRALGYPAAYVAQDGSDEFPPPWGAFDVLFVGGTTDFKLSSGARDLVSQAKNRGMWAHMGRVNSGKRLRYAKAIGCDSADGTYLVFGPDINLPKVLGWVKSVREELPLFKIGEVTA